MAYLGNAPTSVPLSSADILDSAITTAKIANGTIALADLSATGTASSSTFLRGDNVWGAAGGKFESALLHVRDEKAQGTASGSAGTTTTQTRVLNTVVTNEISGASLSSNQITLPAGTYFIISRVPTFMTQAHKAYLRNITDSTNTIIGSSLYATSTYEGHNDSMIYGRFTISAQKVFEIRHYTAVARASNGLGVQTDLSGIIEVFADVQIWKVA